MRNKLLIITGVSASGKTTLQNELLKRGWVRPVNFTTRNPRTDDAVQELLKNKIDWSKDNSDYDSEDFKSKELDEYIFLNKDKYFLKMANGDFLESTNYNGNWYGVSKFLPEGNVCIVLDPVGREQVLEKIVRENLNYDVLCVFLDISKIAQQDRLKKRGDSKEQIELRKKDFNWFSPNSKSLVKDGTEEITELANDIECEILEKTTNSEWIMNK